MTRKSVGHLVEANAPGQLHLLVAGSPSPHHRAGTLLADLLKPAAVLLKDVGIGPAVYAEARDEVA